LGRTEVGGALGAATILTFRYHPVSERGLETWPARGARQWPRMRLPI